MVHFWSGNSFKYRWSVMITLFRDKPWILKVIEFLIGDIKANDFTFRVRTKGRILNCYDTFLSYQKIIEEQKTILRNYYAEIKHIRNYRREFNQIYFYVNRFWQKARKPNSAERKFVYDFWISSYVSFVDKSVKFFKYLTWKEALMMVKEFTRACFRFLWYFFVIHQTMLSETVQKYLYYNHGDNFFHTDVYFMIVTFFPLHAVYRYFMREHYRRRPSVRLMLVIKYYARIYFCYIKYGFIRTYLYLRKTHRLWQIEDKIMDLAIKRLMAKVYNFIVLKFSQLKRRILRLFNHKS